MTKPTFGSIIGRPQVIRHSWWEIPAVQEIGSLFARRRTNIPLPTSTTATIATRGQTGGGTRRMRSATRARAEVTVSGYLGARPPPG